jgi:hypothetical protein
MYNSLFLRLQPATLMHIILHLEATLHKLTPGPSKAKNTALARTVLVPGCLLLLAAQTAWAEIVIDSGEEKDTVMQVGRGVGNENEGGGMIIQSDPDNGSLIMVSPPPAPPGEDADPIPLIIVPEIRIKE